MQESLSLILIAFLLSLGLIAYFLCLRALFPRRTAKTRAVADLMPGRSFGAGLINFLFFGVIIFVLFVIMGQVGGELLKALFALPALFFLTGLGIGVSFGLAGVVELIGERLAPAQTALRRTAWGTLALGFGSALPVVGWFLLLPYAALLGLGAFIISFFYREGRPPAPVENSQAGEGTGV